MVDREIFTYLKNQVQLILIASKKFKFSIFKWNDVIVDGAVSSNPLIVWNNTFGVDDPFMEKPVPSFAQPETENCPRVKF